MRRHDNRPPELHSALQGAPSPAVRYRRALNAMAEFANLTTRTIEMLRTVEPTLRTDCPRGTDAHLKAIERQDYQDACGLMINWGVPKAH